MYTNNLRKVEELLHNSSLLNLKRDFKLYKSNRDLKVLEMPYIKQRASIIQLKKVGVNQQHAGWVKDLHKVLTIN